MKQAKDMVLCLKPPGNWAGAWQNQQNDLCILVKTHINLGTWPVWSVLYVRFKDSLGPKPSSSRQRRLWSDWVNAQTDLSLCWMHRSFCCCFFFSCSSSIYLPLPSVRSCLSSTVSLVPICDSVQTLEAGYQTVLSPRKQRNCNEVQYRESTYSFCINLALMCLRYNWHDARWMDANYIFVRFWSSVWM